MDRRRIVIDGANFSDINGFYAEIDRVLTSGMKTGHNLDALCDVLRGGFGVHGYGEPIEIVWKNMNKSFDELGMDTVSKIVEIMRDEDAEHDCVLQMEF